MVAKTLLPVRQSKSLGVPCMYRRRMWHNCCHFDVCGLFFSFFPLSYSIFILAFKKIKLAPGFCCPYIRFHSYSLHYIFLFRIIYESKFFFSISSLINFFHLSDLILILFITIYFYFRWFLKLFFFFLRFHPFGIFFLSNLKFYYCCCCCCCCC